MSNFIGNCRRYYRSANQTIHAVPQILAEL
jgi:hypothetical protein